MRFRCSEASVERGDEVAGTATNVRSFLLVEEPGPWGVDAVRDSRLPDPVKAWLTAETGRRAVRPLLIRRRSRSGGDGRGAVRVFAAHVGSPRTFLETTILDRVDDVIGLDLSALAAGRPLGLEPTTERVVLVCTHGRHDVCCAEQGRPLAETLAAVEPELVWECSHLGGDRFAGNMLVLPDGLGFGRVTPEQGPRILAGLVAGTLDLDHLRGRSSLPMAAQYAEISLRRELGETGVDAVGYTGLQRSGDTVVASFTATGTSYHVTVRVGAAASSGRLTCKAMVDSPVPDFTTVSVTRTSG